MRRFTISRAFYVTFGVAVAMELVSVALTLSGWYSGWVAEAWWLGQYGPVLALGYLLGGVREPYRTTFVNVLPFIVLWLVVGLLTLRLTLMHSDLDAKGAGQAEWGYLLASILSLPMTFGVAAFGVWCARRFRRVTKDDSSAA